MLSPLFVPSTSLFRSRNTPLSLWLNDVRVRNAVTAEGAHRTTATVVATHGNVVIVRHPDTIRPDNAGRNLPVRATVEDAHWLGVFHRGEECRDRFRIQPLAQNCLG